MDYDSDLAVDIANRINDIMRTLPPGTQPITVMTALCAMMARLITTLRDEDKEPMLQWANDLIRQHSGLRAN